MFLATCQCRNSRPRDATATIPSPLFSPSHSPAQASPNERAAARHKPLVFSSTPSLILHTTSIILHSLLVVYCSSFVFPRLRLDCRPALTAWPALRNIRYIKLCSFPAPADSDICWPYTHVTRVSSGQRAVPRHFAVSSSPLRASILPQLRRNSIRCTCERDIASYISHCAILSAVNPNQSQHLTTL